MGESKNRRYEIPYAVTGGIKHTGSERTPTDICIDRVFCESDGTTVDVLVMGTEEQPLAVYDFQIIAK